MLLPWGHENGPLERRPWVTLALIAVCIGTLVSTRFDPAVQQFGAKIDEAYAYWSAHPYLEPGDLLAGHYGDEGAEARAEFQAAIASGEVPIPKAALAAEQERLEGLTADASAAMEQHVWVRFGLVPSAPRLEGLFGHLFLHAGWAHLIGNLLFLLLTGPFLENRWGRSTYLLFYVGAGVAAAGLFAWRDPFGTSPLIGASGAIAGAMGAFLVVFATVRIKFAYWLGLFWGTFAVPAWLLMPLWFVHELASARLMDLHGATDGVAYWAHVGGFTFGAAVAALFRVTGLDARLAGEEPATRAAPGAETDEEAAPDFAETTEAEPADAPLWAAVARADRTAALKLWKARGTRTELAPGPPEATLRLAGWLSARGQAAAAGGLLGALLPTADPDLAGRIARVAGRIDPELARRAAKRAGPALSPAPPVERAPEAAPTPPPETASRPLPSPAPVPSSEPASDESIETSPAPADRGIDIDFGDDLAPPPTSAPTATPDAFDLPPDFEDDLEVPDDLVLDSDLEELADEVAPAAPAQAFDQTQLDLGPGSESAPPAAAEFDRTQIDLAPPPNVRAPSASSGGSSSELFETDAVDLSEKEDVAPELAEAGLDLGTPGQADAEADAELFDSEAFDLGSDEIE